MEPATHWDGGCDRQRRAGYRARIAGKGTVRTATVENNAAATVVAETQWRDTARRRWTGGTYCGDW